MNILIINGPNLDVLDKRDQKHYGSLSYDDLCNGIQNAFGDHSFDFFQSNNEGILINRLHEAIEESFDGLICNFAGYSHTSVALRDALALIPYTKIEVHLSNIHSREDFRHTTLTGGVCDGIIAGFGPDSYHLAVVALQNKRNS